MVSWFEVWEVDDVCPVCGANINTDFKPLETWGLYWVEEWCDGCDYHEFYEIENTDETLS